MKNAGLLVMPAGFFLSVAAIVLFSSTAPRAAFLRAVRDGACRLFATTLSPDYNVAHRDHFHFDQAARGAVGGRLCR